MQANPGQGQNNQNNQGQQKSTLSWSQPVTAQNAPTSKPVVPPTITTPTSNSPMNKTEDKSHSTTYAVIFILGAAVGMLLGWSIGSSNNDIDTTNTVATTTNTVALTNTNATVSPAVAGTPGSFTVTSPQTAGFAVVVSNILVTSPTWVVVYEDRAGVPGNAIGASLFLPQPQGTAQTGTIELLRATLPGQNYLAGQALDDGDKVFSLENDKPVRDVKGNPVMSLFTAQ